MNKNDEQDERSRNELLEHIKLKRHCHLGLDRGRDISKFIPEGDHLASSSTWVSIPLVVLSPMHDDHAFITPFRSSPSIQEMTCWHQSNEDRLQIIWPPSSSA